MWLFPEPAIEPPLPFPPGPLAPGASDTVGAGEEEREEGAESTESVNSARFGVRPGASVAAMTGAERGVWQMMDLSYQPRSEITLDYVSRQGRTSPPSTRESKSNSV
jgi:hypothetical protein